MCRFTGRYGECVLNDDARYVVTQSGFEIPEELTFNDTVQRNQSLLQLE